MLKSFGKDVAIYASADLLSRATQFLALPFYTQLLPVEDFGILALLTVTGALLGMLLNLGINNSVQRFYFDPGLSVPERATLVSTGLAQLIVSGTIVMAGAFGLLFLFQDDLQQGYGIALYLAVLALANVLPEQLTQYMQDVVRLHFAPVRFLVIALVRGFLGVVIGLWLLIGMGMGVSGVLIGTLAGSLLAVPLGLFIIRQDLRLSFDCAFAHRIFRYGYPFVFAGAAYWIFGSMDRWMLLELTDLAQVGLFSIGMKFAVIVSFVTFAFNRAWSPFAYRMYAEDPDYRVKFARIFSAWFFLLAMGGLGLALFSDELLQLLTPPEYWGAAPILAVAAAGLVLEGTTLITLMGISLQKRTVLMTYCAWVAAFANVALNLVTIPWLGALGAAFSTLFAYGILTGSFLLVSQRLHPIPLEHGKLLYSLGLVGGIVAVPFILGGLPPGPLSFAIKLALLAAAFGGAILVRIIDLKLIRQLARG